MPPEVTTHALLRVCGADSVLWTDPPPAWALAALARAPWVVVRRARGAGLIPVGVRGALRAQRLAAWLHPGQVLESVTPTGLAERRGWLTSERRTRVPALAALDAVDALLRDRGIGWGPCGSVGFELASGTPTASPASDLDVMIPAATPLPPADAVALLAALARLPVRIDVQLEVPHGAVALAEYAAARGPLVLRTVDGARLVRDPWGAVVPAAA
jgi:phosphoribosyl-dephospho-CoA transferase